MRLTRIRHAILLVLLVAAPAHAAERDVVRQAMEDELARSMASLRMESLEKPYFISYRVDETVNLSVGATFGSLTGSDLTRGRRLTVELRVGERGFDNTNYFAMTRSMFLGGGQQARLPLEDDYREIRRAIWLATDAAYKDALETLAKKRATLQNKTRPEELPDFAEQTPAQVFDAPPGPPPDRGPLEALVRDLSKLFRTMPQVSSSAVSLEWSSTYTRYVNSEGTRFARSEPEVDFVVRARSFASDGLPLRDFTAFFARDLAGLPPRERLAESVRALGERLAALQKAPLLETYNGPVLFEGEAAAELWSQVMAPALAASRRPVTENPQLDALFQRQGSLSDKIGARVLPRFLSVVDDPTRSRAGAEILLGGYSVDDDGVPASSCVLAESGLLTGLLATRDPAPGALKSNGHRRGSEAVPSNLIVTASASLADRDLRRKLLELAKANGLPYALIVRRISDPLLLPEQLTPAAMMAMFGVGGESQPLPPVIAAYELLPDGREQLVRNVQITGIGTGAFKDIVAVSAAPTTTTLPFGAGGSVAAAVRRIAGGSSGALPLISVVTPSLLFEEATLKKPVEEVPKPPVAKHPYFAK